MAASSIAKLSVLFTSDSSGFDKNIKKSLGQTSKQFAAWGKKVAFATAGAATALGGVIASASKAADSLSKTSSKLGVTIDQLAGLRHAGEQTGVSMNTMDMAVQRMTRRIAEAAIGTGEAKGAIEELGLSAVELNNIGPAEAMKRIAEAMKGVENQGDKVRLAMKLFDSEGVALVNTLDLGADGLREMQEEAVRLGISFSDVDAAKFVALNDNIDVMRKQFTGLRNTLAVELLPVVEMLVGWFEKLSLAQTFKAFADGWRSAIASAIGHVMNFSATFAELLADVGDGTKKLIGNFPTLINSVAAVIAAVVNTVIGSINAMIKGAVAGINMLNSAVSALPFVDDITPINAAQIDPINLPSNSSDYLSAAAGAFSAKQREVAAASRAMAADAMASADEFALAMNATLEGSNDAAAASTKLTKIAVDNIESAGGAAKKSAESAAVDTVEAMEAASEAAARAAEEMRRPWLNALSDMGSGLGDLITTGKTQWENFGDFFKSITLKMVADYLVAWAEGLVKRIAMEMAVTGTKSSIGWVSAVAGAFTGPQSSYFGSGNLTGLATGGSASGGVPYLVGERGPEIMVPGSSGQVMPNHKIGGGGGGNPINITQNFSTGVSESQLFEATRATFEAAKAGVVDAVTRGGAYRRAMQY